MLTLTWRAGTRLCPSWGAEMWGDTADPYLGGLGYGVTLLWPSWGAEMWGDTAVPYLGGLVCGVTLLCPSWGAEIWGDSAVPHLGGWDGGWHCCPLFGGLGHGMAPLCPSWVLRCGVTLLSLIWGPWDTTVPFLGGRDVG